jgi:hypothetical protein
MTSNDGEGTEHDYRLFYPATKPDRLLDGDALVNAIDRAMSDGDWVDAVAVWEYIKSRRIELRETLGVSELQTLTQAIATLRERSVFVLAKGALEAYLPLGLRSKDINKLIRFTQSSSFWSEIASEAQTELITIAKAILA